MPETKDPAVSPELNSVAEKLKAAGFHKTSIARAVAELVGEYLGIHANMGDNLVTALGKTNAGALEVLGIPTVVPSPAIVANDSRSTEQKSV